MTLRLSLFALTLYGLTLLHVITTQDSPCPPRGTQSLVKQLGIPMLSLMARFFVTFKATVDHEPLEVNLTERIEGDKVEIETLRKRFMRNLSNIDGDQVLARYLMIRPLSYIDAFEEVEKGVASRVSFYLNQTKGHLEKMTFDDTKVSDALTQMPREFLRVAHQRYPGCIPWTEQLEADWKRFRSEPNQPNSTLGDTLRMFKQTSSNLKTRSAELWQLIPPEKRFYLSVTTEFEMILSEKSYQKMEVFFDDYLRRLNTTSTTLTTSTSADVGVQ